MWTFIRGEMYVSCDGGCQPLPLEGLIPTPGMMAEVDWDRTKAETELRETRRVDTPEGGSAGKR